MTDGPQEVVRKLQSDYAVTVAAELVIWPGWQIFTFRLVPLQHQLMTSNVLTLGEAVALPLAESNNSWLRALMALTEAPATPTQLAAPEHPGVHV